MRGDFWRTDESPDPSALYTHSNCTSTLTWNTSEAKWSVDERAVKDPIYSPIATVPEGVSTSTTIRIPSSVFVKALFQGRPGFSHWRPYDYMNVSQFFGLRVWLSLMGGRHHSAVNHLCRFAKKPTDCLSWPRGQAHGNGGNTHDRDE